MAPSLPLTSSTTAETMLLASRKALGSGRYRRHVRVVLVPGHLFIQRYSRKNGNPAESIMIPFKSMQHVNQTFPNRFQIDLYDEMDFIGDYIELESSNADHWIHQLRSFQAECVSCLPFRSERGPVCPIKIPVSRETIRCRPVKTPYPVKSHLKRTIKMSSYKQMPHDKDLVRKAPVRTPHPRIRANNDKTSKRYVKTPHPVKSHLSYKQTLHDSELVQRAPIRTPHQRMHDKPSKRYVKTPFHKRH